MQKAPDGTEGSPAGEVIKPKRNLSAFFIWMREVRPQLQAASPEQPFVEQTKQMAAMWKEMGEEERVKYEELAALDKARYKAEIKVYEEKYGKSKPKEDPWMDCHHSN